MSLGYAEKLSYREDLGGQLGAPELFDSPKEVEAKAEQLAELVRKARRIVVFTGAGISTACGIPDFRGPGGIWTLQRAGEPLPRPKVSFTHAKPSLTHQVLVGLVAAGKLDYLVSQNVDGLHLRSGIPRDRLAELHGNCFAERCHTCGTEYVRDFEVETVGFKETGRRCSQPGCGSALRDGILDWEDALPEDELALSDSHSREADLAICLGTSLQITPACNLPLKATRVYKDGTKQQPGQLAIINLQKTQHDNKAVKSGGLVCHARCDDVMRLLARKLRLEVPRFVRRDAVVIGHQQLTLDGMVCDGLAADDAAAQPGGSSANHAVGSVAADVAVDDSVAPSSCKDEDGDCNGAAVTFSLFVQSSHGPACPLPMVQAVHIAFKDPQLEPATLEAPPFAVRRTAPGGTCVHALITLHLHTAADEDKRAVQLSYLVQLQAGLEVGRREERHDFVTQEATFDVEEAAAAAVAKAEEQQDQQQQQQQQQEQQQQQQQQLKKQRVK